MSKYLKVLFIVVCVIQFGCSLAPSAASISHKAFIRGDYNESLRLTNRALSTYEYNDEEKANLMLLKANNYAKLNQTAYSIGVILYIIKTFPETEASYKARALLSSLKKQSVNPIKSEQTPPKQKA